MKAYFPGSFNPPTYGHLEILRKACEIFTEVIVVCSTNPNKEYQIKPEDRVMLWKSYDLPANCQVLTFEQAVSEMIPGESKTMVRGLRNADDIEHETSVMELNHREYGFDKFFYAFAPPAFSTVSSSRCRQLAINGDFQYELRKMVGPNVEQYLIDLYWTGPSLAGFKDEWE